MIEVLRRSGNWTQAVLVDVLPRGQNIEAKFIWRYYGLNAPPRAFLSMSVARMVFKVGPDSYYVVPDHRFANRYWRFTSEFETGR